GRGPDAAGREHDVGLGHRLTPGPLDPLGIVADGQHGDDVDAEFEELVGDPLRVRVGDAPRRELVAGREDGGTFDHRTSRTTRVRSPAYAPATRSSPTTPKPPRPRRSIAPAGNGLTTSKTRNAMNASTAAVHVAGAKSAAVAMPATSSITMA